MHKRRIFQMPSFLPSELTCGAHLARTALTVAALAAWALPAAHAAGVSSQGTWETTLQARDLDGDAATIEAYYDTDLSITWLADANYAHTSGYTDAASGGVIRESWWGNGDNSVKLTDGAMGWDAAQAWASDLSINNLTGWRLPTIVDTGPPGCEGEAGYMECEFNLNFNKSELAHIFIRVLGNKQYYDVTGQYQGTLGLTNTGPFLNVGWDGYWSGNDYPGYPYDANVAWFFSPAFVDQGYGGKDYPLFAWAVHDGDVGVAVTSVPEPEAYAMALVGLAAASLLARKRRA
jgi:PEP-CTERM motif